MLRTFALWACTLIACPVAAQEVPTPVVAEPTDPLAEPPVDPLAAVLAFTDYDERMSVPVRLNGSGPYRFIIDTGAERTVIAHQVAGMLGLAAGRTVNIAAMTGSSPAATVLIPSLEIDAVPRGLRIEAPSLDRAHLGADGLVGIDSLAGSAVQIDFEANEMHVAKAFRRRRASNPGEIVVRAKTLAGRLIVSDASYAGKRIAVILDTGTSVSIGNAKLLDLVRKRSTPLRPVELTSVTGDVLMVEHHQVPRITIGGAEFQHLGIAFADVAPFRRLGLDDRPALFLGMDAMRLFRKVRIDFANREVRFLLPRQSFRTASLTGTRMP
ncbi:retroviral-like aspartic protease family protein [Sphingomonas sp. S1-29]|uniref:retropepsin-like aspartic protease n=1 Tax=Sphingomonas sp. S1-29 TaxID=2991074 RepID=UPI002240C95A|nr:retropepsin-like aspartic protease [Sphingomonas sp. S1-29]UZK69100.1 retroviral-like aspartic protease family protein [Sphingomonas sp. S1-29]